MSKVGDGNYTICSGAMVFREWSSTEYDYRRGLYVNNGFTGNSVCIGAITFGRINNDETGWNGAGTPQVRPFLAF